MISFCSTCQVIFYSAALVPFFFLTHLWFSYLFVWICVYFIRLHLFVLIFEWRIRYELKIQEFVYNIRRNQSNSKSEKFLEGEGEGKEKEIDVINNGWGEEMTRSCPFEDKATDHILSDSNVLKIQRSSRQVHQVVHAGLARAWINWIKKSFSRGKGKGFPNDWALFFRREMHSPSPLIEKCN